MLRTQKLQSSPGFREPVALDNRSDSGEQKDNSQNYVSRVDSKKNSKYYDYDSKETSNFNKNIVYNLFIIGK